MLRTVFFGTPDFALPSLEACLRHSQLLGVVSQPDRPRGRGQELLPSPVKAKALEAKLPVFTPPSLRKASAELDELRAFMRKAKADLCVVTAYGNLFPEEFLNAHSRLGSVNLHASLLPRWRGAAPIQRCLEAGDRETGVCLQKMQLELDAGDVLAESRMPLDSDIQSPELSKELSTMGGELLAAFLAQNPDTLKGKAQNEADISFAAKIDRQEGLWTPEWSALETHNRVRAFRAWPGVRANFEKSGDFKFIKTALGLKEPSIRSGELTLKDGEVLLGCCVRSGEQANFVRILELQPANRAVMPARAFVENLLRQESANSVFIRKASL